MDKSIMQSIAYEAMNYSWCGSDAELLPASELMTTNYRILLQTFPDCYGKSRQEVSELFTKKKDFMNFITNIASGGGLMQFLNMDPWSRRKKADLVKKVVQEAEAATRRIREIKQMKVWDWPFETESSWGPSGKLVCNWMANEKAKNPKKFEAKKPVPAPLTVNIKHHLTGELYSFKVNNLIPISTLFKVYSNKTGLQQHTMKFKYNDEVFGYANKKFNGSKSLKKMKFKDNQTLEYTVNLPELYLGAVEDEVKYLGITSALTSSSSSSGEGSMNEPKRKKTKRSP